MKVKSSMLQKLANFAGIHWTHHIAHSTTCASCARWLQNIGYVLQKKRRFAGKVWFMLYMCSLPSLLTPRTFLFSRVVMLFFFLRFSLLFTFNRAPALLDNRRKTVTSTNIHINKRLLKIYATQSTIGAIVTMVTQAAHWDRSIGDHHNDIPHSREVLFFWSNTCMRLRTLIILYVRSWRRDIISQIIAFDIHYPLCGFVCGCIHLRNASSSTTIK